LDEKKYVLKPVKELPKRRLRRETVYDDLVDEFLASKEKYVEVLMENKKPATVLSALRKRAKNKKIIVRSMGGKIYLERQ